MIISRWRGFEIDSSEGFYYFDTKTERADEAWDFMCRLLASPLIWDRIAFSVAAVEGEGDKVNDRIEAVLERASPKENESISEFCEHDHASRIPAFLGLVKELKPSIASIGFNFCLAPFDEMPAEESARLRMWFLKLFSDRKEANRRWREYSRVRRSDFVLGGNSRMTDEWTDTYAFEASFDLSLTPPFSYGMSISAGDPSLILYLLATLTARYDLHYGGDHYISIDLQPDLLELEISPEGEDEEPLG